MSHEQGESGNLLRIEIVRKVRRTDTPSSVDMVESTGILLEWNRLRKHQDCVQEFDCRFLQFVSVRCT